MVYCRDQNANRRWRKRMQFTFITTHKRSLSPSWLRRTEGNGEKHGGCNPPDKVRRENKKFRARRTWQGSLFVVVNKMHILNNWFIFELSLKTSVRIQQVHANPNPKWTGQKKNINNVIEYVTCDETLSFVCVCVCVFVNVKSRCTAQSIRHVGRIVSSILCARFCSIFGGEGTLGEDDPRTQRTWLLPSVFFASLYCAVRASYVKKKWNASCLSCLSLYF